MMWKEMCGYAAFCYHGVAAQKRRVLCGCGSENIARGAIGKKTHNNEILHLAFRPHKRQGLREREKERVLDDTF